ncbi:MAG: nuclear transport factor 2 family protein [Taibaiella sp.]|nr:nuclear transport factor 2 family protein [Taibaiella sp.]
MKVIFSLLLMLACGHAMAQQPDVKMLEKTLKIFDKALLDRDTVTLNRLVSDSILYGHSNGWTETKQEMKDDLYNNKLVYLGIRHTERNIKIDGNTAAVRTTSNIEALLTGKDQEFKLKVLQVWVWKNKNWELFARQSAPLK